MVTIDLDPTFFWQLANFLVLIWLLNTILFKPVRNILKKRAGLTAELKSDIESNQEVTLEHEQALNERQLETKSQGMKVWEELKKQAQGEELAKLQEAMRQNSEILNQQRAEIQNQIELAGAKLDHEVDQFAREIAGKILQRSLS